MPEFIGTSRSLTMGLVASVAVHAAGVVGLARYGDAWRHGFRSLADRPDPARLEVPEPQPLVLGIAESPHKTDTWLGFADPTEHLAHAAPVEQSAMEPDPGARGAEQPIAKAEPAARPAPATPPKVEPSPVEALPVEPPAPEVKGVHTPETSPGEPVAASVGVRPEEPLEKPASAETEPQPPAPTPAPTEAAQVGPPAPTAPPPQPEVAAAPPAPPVPPGTTSGQRPGERSDRQSTPAAIKGTIDVRPGRVAATEGLEIKTVRPEWSDTTRLAALPRNPIVRITFARTGKVTNVDFLPGLSTGYREVDEPLKDALYRWTAKGKALAALPNSADAGLIVQFRILLR